MKHLWLVGMMGSGKTSVGSHISDLTCVRFVDTDQLIVEEHGLAVADIFRLQGEFRFRQYENKVLSKAAAESQSVVATGGGVVVDRINIDLMRSTGTVVFLATQVSTLVERIGDDTGRPLLHQADPQQVLTEILHQRQALYDQAAHATINTDELTPDQVAGKAILLWNRS